LSAGPRSSGTCNRDAGREDPKSGSREAGREDQDPRAGNPKDGSNSSRGASSAVEGRNTRKEDLKEARNAAAVRGMATVSAKIADCL
jgi:hypothetical protein